MAAGGDAHLIGAAAAADPTGPRPVAPARQPEYPRGEQAGYFLWYVPPRVYVRFNSEGSVHFAYTFEVRVDGGTLSDLQTVHWNSTDTIETDAGDQEAGAGGPQTVAGRGYVTSGSDGFSFTVPYFDSIEFDLRQSEPFRKSATSDEKVRRVETADYVRRDDQIYLGAEHRTVASIVDEGDAVADSAKPTFVINNTPVSPTVAAVESAPEPDDGDDAGSDTGGSDRPEPPLNPDQSVDPTRVMDALPGNRFAYGSLLGAGALGYLLHRRDQSSREFVRDEVRPRIAIVREWLEYCFLLRPRRRR